MTHFNNGLYCGDNLLVILDSGISGHADLAEKISPSAKVVLLDPNQDAIAQITAALDFFDQPFASLHLIVECSPGVMHFANGDFSLKTLSGYAEPVQKWFVSYGSTRTQQTPEVFIYGHRFTAGKMGQQFTDTLAWLTGANIAAASIQVGKPLQGIKTKDRQPNSIAHFS